MHTKSAAPVGRNNLLIAGVILAAASMSAAGADNYASGELYRETEVSVDLFGSVSLGGSTIDHLTSARIRHDARLGGGAGLNYFFTRNIGVGVDAYSEDSTGSLIDYASASLILRLPLGSSGFAPYAFGGGGRQFDGAEAWFAQLGAGIEYRFTPQLGLFLDARGVLPEETKYYGVVRLGLRFAF
jgi:hypothetical protein